MIGRLLCGLGLHARGTLVRHRVFWSLSSGVPPTARWYERCPRCGRMEPIQQEALP